MDAAKYNESVNALFDAWREEYKNEDAKYLSEKISKLSFKPDGVICPEKFFSQNERYLFIAKECHDEGDENNFWLQEVAQGDKESEKFSKRFSVLVNALISNDFTNISQSTEAFNYIAFMNLNKRGGFASCDPRVLEAYTEHYKNYILDEIKLINPTTIICCGADVRKLIEKFISSDVKIISIWHPSYRRSYGDHLNKLKEALENK